MKIVTENLRVNEMQVIYLDTLICVNLFIDYILLSTTKSVLHIHNKYWRVLAGALIGALSSLIAFLPFYSVFISAINKIGSAILIVYVAFGKTDFRKFCVRFMTFLGFSMIFSMAVILTNNLFSTKKLIIYNDVIYFDISPTALLITTAITYGIICIYSKVASVHKLRCEIHRITVSTERINRLTFESALDTGCNLKEPFSGLPVILTEESIFDTTGINENKLRVIPYSTAAGSDIILGFKPDSIEIDGKSIDKGCYIGICKNKLKGEVKSIMGSELLEVI